MKKIIKSIIIVCFFTSCQKDMILATEKLRNSEMQLRYLNGTKDKFVATSYMETKYDVNTREFKFIPNIGCPSSVRFCDSMGVKKDVVGMSELGITYNYCK